MNLGQDNVILGNSFVPSYFRPLRNIAIYGVQQEQARKQRGWAIRRFRRASVDVIKLMSRFGAPRLGGMD